MTVGTIVALIVAIEVTRRLLDRFGDQLETAAARETAAMRAAYDQERAVRAAMPRVEWEVWCALQGLEP